MTVHNTKEDIRNTFIDLYKTNSVNSITVDMICKRSFISRSTFYKFYKNVAAVNQEIEDSIIDAIKQTRTDTSYQSIFSLPKDTPSPDFVAMVRFLLDNADYMNAVFSEHGNPAFYERYRHLNFEFMREFAESNNVPEDKLDIAADVITDALMTMQKKVLLYHDQFDPYYFSLSLKNMVVNLTSEIRDS